ncbi:MAG TPA: GGDEF domain-containing protein, partial [Burkholderiales bacterium]|nr:GGDEF domain-containing protein [Burkholderiales bacterium]
MGLDVRTIMVMFAVLAFMFAVLLEVARLQAGDIKGIRHWAIANLFIALGFGLAFFYDTFAPGYRWAVVAGSTLIAWAISLQYCGIQAFRGKSPDWRTVALPVIWIFAQSVWFAVLHPDVGVRSMANSLLYAAGFAACARALFVDVDQPLKTAYRFTGYSFAVLAVLLLVRIMVIGFSPAHSYTSLYSQIPVNPLAFFLGGILQLFVTFGFVLMLNYRLVADMQKLASRDILTGAHNRRWLEEEAVLLWARHLRTGDTLSVMLIDIDDFKLINDCYGHPAGDEVLRRLVAIAQGTIRTDDFFARYGGDEFCILLPSTTQAEALVLAERLRSAYVASDYRFNGKLLASTVTIGVADCMQGARTFAELVAAA